MKNILFILVLLIGIIPSSFSHGYHVSITQIDYNKETHALEIALKLITEDVEFVLENQGTDKLFLGEKNELPKANEYIKSYLSKHFIVSINDKITQQTYLGKEVDKGETWYYIEIKNVTELTSLSIKSTIFTETFHNQVNRVNIKAKDKIKSFVLSPAKIEDRILF